MTRRCPQLLHVVALLLALVTVRDQVRAASQRASDKNGTETFRAFQTITAGGADSPAAVQAEGTYRVDCAGSGTLPCEINWQWLVGRTSSDAPTSVTGALRISPAPGDGWSAEPRELKLTLEVREVVRAMGLPALAPDDTWSKSIRFNVASFLPRELQLRVKTTLLANRPDRQLVMLESEAAPFRVLTTELRRSVLCEYRAVHVYSLADRRLHQSSSRFTAHSAEGGLTMERLVFAVEEESGNSLIPLVDASEWLELGEAVEDTATAAFPAWSNQVLRTAELTAVAEGVVLGGIDLSRDDVFLLSSPALQTPLVLGRLSEQTAGSEDVSP